LLAMLAVAALVELAAVDAAATEGSGVAGAADVEAEAEAEGLPAWATSGEAGDGSGPERAPAPWGTGSRPA
jgi:hypothetical protein